MGSLLQHTMWHSTCSSHTANLLAKDVLNIKLVENVVLVLKEFKHPDFEKIIINKGGHRIKLPAETRWCSYRNSFRKEVRTKLVEIQDPICELINTAQNSDTSIADAANLWLELKLPEEFNEQLRKRQEMALNKYALTAYYLHPSYDRSKLSGNQKSIFKLLNEKEAHIHSLLRNRFTFENSKKLIHIYFTLRLENENPHHDLEEDADFEDPLI
ncbi:hypothetical protein NQ315_014304 [Exocentrus adspersus]|uniref:Transposase n=1 Tax=Exocentrus adspersus TaxID=1586481 RepID=A0AAV8VJL4_9CUCU|nr:hypothetical protein NQ315_014304 [Exocentrus adspersus]